VSTTKLEWKSIKVPKPAYDKIKMLKQKTGLHMGQVVTNAVEMYELILTKPWRKKELPELDKLSWYIYKLVVGVGAYKENPTKENFARLMTTMEQIKKRLGVDTGVLEHAVKRIHPSRSPETTKQDLIEIAQACKNVIANMIAKTLMEAGEHE